MNKYARTAISKNIEIISIVPPFSIFDFIEEKFNRLAPLHRILSQVRENGGKTLVSEIITDSEDIIEENEDIRKRVPDFTETNIIRLSFFRKTFLRQSNIKNITQKDFLGYAIVKTDRISNRTYTRVYESVVVSCRHDNNFIRNIPVWQCRIAGVSLKVQGYIYAQQNNITNVCAHVTLRTVAARYHKKGDMSYREMNQIIGVDHIKNKVGGTDGRGLNNDEMIRILKTAGASCFVGDFTLKESRIVSFQRYIYGSIESGYPAIIIFRVQSGSGQDYHAIPVFGHTFNSDMWVPKAELSYFRIGKSTQYIPSDSWLSTFLAHDDNFGSNFCIPKTYLYTNNNPQSTLSDDGKNKQEECVAYVIGTLPEKVKVNPIRAEVVGADYLFSILPQLPSDSGKWGKRLLEFARIQRLVLRPLLIDSGEYSQHLSKVKDWTGRKFIKSVIDVLHRGLGKEIMWMIELSVPELFSTNQRKIGEVLLRAEVPTGDKRDFRNFVLARLPGYFAFAKVEKKGNPQFSFVQSGIKSHIELFGCERKS